jgi:hypothetical protein
LSKRERQSEQNIEIRLSNIKTQINLVYNCFDERVPLHNLDTMAESLHKNFIKVTTNDILLGLKQGAFGKYGIPFKLNVMSLGRFIYKHLEDKQKAINKY